MQTPNNPVDAPVTDASQKERFGKRYLLDQIRRTPPPPSDYFAKLTALRVLLIQQCYRDGLVLDLCCGAGDFLPPVAAFADSLLGVDFSPGLIAMAGRLVQDVGVPEVCCAGGDAKHLPLQDGCAALLYSFSALYCIPDVGQAVRECARVLAPGGVALLEFGIRPSLNIAVSRAYVDSPVPCPLTLREVHRLVHQAGLTVEQDRAFQLLPLWGDRPRWLRPLLGRGFKRLAALEIAGRMLDERVSSLPLLRRFAFRHLLVCRKDPLP